MIPVGLRLSAALFSLRGLLKANGWTATREVVEATRHELLYRSLDRLPNDRAIPRLAKGVEFDPNRPRHPDGRQALGYHDRTPHQPRDRPLPWLKKERPRMSALI